MQKIPITTAVLLTWIAGFVDAVGFVSLGRIYTANMSGNSVAIGIQWASQDWPEMVRRIWPVVAYVAGLLFGRILLQFGAREQIRSIASAAFLIEIALLTPALLAQLSSAETASGIVFVFVGLLAIAMGIQNAALTRFSSLTLHTGFVTGTLVKFAEEFTKYITWAFDHLRGPSGSIGAVVAASSQQKALQAACWLAATWVAYVVGACCGALGDHAFKLKSLAVPIGALVIVIAIDLGRPLAICEEQDQAKLST